MNSNIQQNFLDNVCKGANPVTIFLMNGIKLQGVITDFDDSVIVLRRDGVTQVLYKQAISTVMVNSTMATPASEK